MNETIQRVEGDEQLAYNLKEGAARMGISYGSLRNEIARRKIFPTDRFKLLTKAEMLRYLQEEVQITRQKAFAPRINRRAA